MHAANDEKKESFSASSNFLPAPDRRSHRGAALAIDHAVLLNGTSRDGLEANETSSKACGKCGLCCSSTASLLVVRDLL
jgi:hypothetical protein